MPYFCYKFHFRGPKWIFFWKVKMAFEKTPFTKNINK